MREATPTSLRGLWHLEPRPEKNKSGEESKAAGRSKGALKVTRDCRRPAEARQPSRPGGRETDVEEDKRLWEPSDQSGGR